MYMYQDALNDYMTKDTPDRHMLETAHGLVDGMHPSPRFFVAACPKCHMIVDVLPRRVVTTDQYIEWDIEMRRIGLRVSARMARSLCQEKACRCKRKAEEGKME